MDWHEATNDPSGADDCLAWDDVEWKSPFTSFSSASFRNGDAYYGSAILSLGPGVAVVLEQWCNSTVPDHGMILAEHQFPHCTMYLRMRPLIVEHRSCLSRTRYYLQAAAFRVLVRHLY